MKENYKVVIVEDEIQNIELLEYLIQKYFPELTIVGIAQNIDEADVLLNKKEVDIAFLDITLHKRSVFELFKENITPKYQIIFITAYEYFALEAIKISPIDYLLKPINTEDFINAVNKAKEKSKTQPSFNQSMITQLSNLMNTKPLESKIVISSNKEVQLVNLEDIICFSSQRQYTIFLLISGKEIVSSKNLGEYLKIISSPLFFRIHKSHVINIHHLSKIEKENGNYCVLSNNKILPISQRKYKELLQFLNH